jgi:hypothetical protein
VQDAAGILRGFTAAVFEAARCAGRSLEPLLPGCNVLGTTTAGGSCWEWCYRKALARAEVVRDLAENLKLQPP